MMFSVCVVLLAASSAMACETESSLTGKIGNQEIPIHVQLAERDMLATISRPVNAPADFRETTNLHIFETHIVAMKNSQDKHCYISRFADTHDQIKGRLMNADFNDGRIGNVTESRFILEGVTPLTSRTVTLLLGRKVADFCVGHDVYVISKENKHVLSPKEVDIRTLMNVKQGEVTVVGICCGEENY